MLGVFSIAVLLIRDAEIMTLDTQFLLLGVLTILIVCLIVPESMHQNAVRSLTPIAIYETGIQIYTPWYRRLFGEPDFIPGSTIGKLEIDIGDDFTDTSIFANAPRTTGPISLKLKTINGVTYYSGIKKSEELAQIISVIVSKWPVTIEEKVRGRNPDRLTRPL